MGIFIVYFIKKTAEVIKIERNEDGGILVKDLPSEPPNK